MSDVPAAAWWLAALVLAMGSGTWTAGLAGCAASAAVLTRPNLVPVLGVVGLMSLGKPPRLGRAVAFAAGAVPGCRDRRGCGAVRR